MTGLRAGFGAIGHRPEMRALWRPHEYAIKPRWNAGTKEPQAK
jgi:hypothetical protein